MILPPRPYQDIVAALAALGCEKFSESEKNILMVRGATLKLNVPKIFGIPRVIQEHYCERLKISRATFASNIPRPSRALVPADEATPVPVPLGSDPPDSN